MNIRRILISTVVSGSLLIGAPAAAFASTHSTPVKAGAACTKKQLNKTTKVGKKTFVCKVNGKKYEWKVKA